ERAAPPLAAGGAAGIALDQHLRVQVGADGLHLWPTDELRRALGGGGVTWVAEPGTAVEPGDPLVRLGAGPDRVVLGAPVAGVAAPGGAAVHVVPTRWEDDAAAIAWGRAADRWYAAELAAAARRHEDPFRFVRATWLRASAHVRSAADVRAALQALRDAPRFATEAEVEARVADRLRRALAHHGTARAVLRLPIRVTWRMHDPGADLTLDLTAAAPAVRFGEPPAAGDLVLHAAAETVDDFLLGRLDVAAALRRRALQSSASRAAVLRAASVLKALQPAYAAAGDASGVAPGLGR
ncbi:MAG TPA: hypothetical protein VF533_17805, partial [Solirubrobacteraceae bacterium]